MANQLSYQNTINLRQRRTQRQPSSLQPSSLQQSERNPIYLYQMFREYNNNSQNNNLTQEQLYRYELFYIQSSGCTCSECYERVMYITEEIDKLQKKPIKPNIVKNIKKVKTNKECCICLSCDSDCESYLLPCRHEIHVECLDDWFKYNHTCPICRKDFNKMNGYNFCGRTNISSNISNNS